MSILLNLIYAIGAWKLVFITWNCLVILWKMCTNFIYVPNLFAKYALSSSSFALITGSSDGIGEEYAKVLASQGFNIILVSRTLSKMEKVKQDIIQ